MPIGEAEVAGGSVVFRLVSGLRGHAGAAKEQRRGASSELMSTQAPLVGCRRKYVSAYQCVHILFFCTDPFSGSTQSLMRPPVDHRLIKEGCEQIMVFPAQISSNMRKCIMLSVCKRNTSLVWPLQARKSSVELLTSSIIPAIQSAWAVFRTAKALLQVCQYVRQRALVGASFVGVLE